MSKIVSLKTSILLLALTGNALSAIAANRCEDRFIDKVSSKASPQALVQAPARSSQVSWAESVNALK